MLRRYRLDEQTLFLIGDKCAKLRKSSLSAVKRQTRGIPYSLAFSLRTKSLLENHRILFRKASLPVKLLNLVCFILQNDLLVQLHHNHL